MTKRATLQKRKIEAKKELDDIVIKQNNLLKEKNKLLESIVSLQNKQKSPPQRQRPNSYNIAQQNLLREQRIAELVKKKVDKEEQIQELEAEANKLKQEIQNREIRESELAISLKDADQIEKNASQQVKEALVKERDLAIQLEKAGNDLAQAKQHQNAYAAFVREFDDFYKGFSFFKSHFESAYNNALSKSLTGYLNCDPELDLSILLKKDYYTIENALAESCTSFSKYINELTTKLVNHLRKADNSIIKSEDIARAEYLANRFNKLISISKEHIMRLTNILGGCLENLNKERSLIRKNSLRRIICYVSVIMVKYLSYWLPKEFSSGTNQYDPWRDTDLTGSYCDIFIVFALLEDRINGTLPEGAGILIVRDIISDKK